MFEAEVADARGSLLVEGLAQICPMLIAHLYICTHAAARWFVKIRTFPPALFSYSVCILVLVGSSADTFFSSRG